VRLGISLSGETELPPITSQQVPCLTTIVLVKLGGTQGLRYSSNRGVHNSLFGFQSALIFLLTNSTSNVKVGSNFTPHDAHTTRNQQAIQAGPLAGTNGWDTDSENLNSLLDSLEQA
jgi:hypothetical protein